MLDSSKKNSASSPPPPSATAPPARRRMNEHDRILIHQLQSRRPVTSFAFGPSRSPPTNTCVCFSFAAIAAAPTRLLGASPRRRAAGSVPRCIEGGHADHVGGVASQILQLHPSFRHEQSPQPLRLILTLEFPKVDLRGIRSREWLLMHVDRCRSGNTDTSASMKLTPVSKPPPEGRAVSFYSLQMFP